MCPHFLNYCYLMRMYRIKRVQLLHLLELWTSLPESPAKEEGLQHCASLLMDTETQLKNM